MPFSECLLYGLLYRAWASDAKCCKNLRSRLRTLMHAHRGLLPLICRQRYLARIPTSSRCTKSSASSLRARTIRFRQNGVLSSLDLHMRQCFSAISLEIYLLSYNIFKITRKMAIEPRKREKNNFFCFSTKQTSSSGTQTNPIGARLVVILHLPRL